MIITLAALLWLSTTQALPTDTASLTDTTSVVCYAAGTKWVPNDPVMSVIPEFCVEAVALGVQDPGSNQLLRTYLSGGKDQVNLAIQWPSGNAWTPTMDACVANLNSILACNEAPPGGQNPMNWKFGGALTDGAATYLVVPQIDREYTPGVCSFHLYELESNPYVPEETNGYWYPPEYLLQNLIRDGSGNVVSTLTGNHNEYGVDGKDPYIYNGFYAPLEMTPEQAAGDYVQFSIGAIAWSTKASADGGHCNVGGWTVVRPIGRDMDCFFPC